MRVSLKWLKEIIDLGVPTDELCQRMTMLGLEIESVERPGDEIQKVVVGEILSIEPHPDADKLVVCRTDVGEGEALQIVCGARNMSVGDKVPTAGVGGQLPGGLKIGKRKMRGVESQGMMCSARELGLGEDHEGLLIMDGSAGVGEDARALLGLDDTVLEIEVTPNRNDWAGMFGVARELAAAYGEEFKLPKISIKESGKKAAKLSSVTIEDPDLCPRYVGRVIENVRMGPSPQWLAQRLIASGQRPINNVVDITNFVLMETGHPLHAFDFDKLQEQRIVVRRAKAGEQLLSIDQEERTLTEDMLVIADAKAAVAVAGVMGGFDCEVGEGTKNVFIESAYFAPVSIRRTARALNMITEASQRFQRGADPEMALYAANRAAELMQEVAGGEVASGVLDEYPNPPKRAEVALRYARAQTFLGTEVPPEEQKKSLIALGFESVDESKEGITVRAPSWRHDVSREADLIEEVGRLHGYDRVPSTVPRIRRNEEDFAPEYDVLRRLRNYLVGTGMTEMINWTFSSQAEVRDAGLNGTCGRMVELENPLSERHGSMRTTLIPGMLRSSSNNLRKSRQNLRSFEVGPVYASDPSEELPEQGTRLVLALSGTVGEPHWGIETRPVDFYDLKGRVEGVLFFLGLADASFEEIRESQLWGLERAEIRVGKTALGQLGKVCPAVLDAFEAPEDIYLAEIELDAILTQKTPHNPYVEIPAFPPSLRDLAVVVDETIAAGEVRRITQESGGKHLSDVALFDIYAGEQVPPGKKSVALSLTFQSKERTLTDKDTQKACDKIVKNLEKRLGATLR